MVIFFLFIYNRLSKIREIKSKKIRSIVAFVLEFIHLKVENIINYSM